VTASDQTSQAQASTADHEIVLSRVFDAPRELVFKAWTDSHHIAQWWGPNGFTTTVHEMDVRPGGVWRFVMHGPDGVDYDNKMVFAEVVEPDAGFDTIVTFVNEGAKTRLTIRQVYATAAEREYVARKYHAVEMGNQTFDRFAEYLATRLRAVLEK
jgi:uncharacterized protein YndB with AHSA1/START domain